MHAHLQSRDILDDLYLTRADSAVSDDLSGSASPPSSLSFPSANDSPPAGPGVVCSCGVPLVNRATANPTVGPE